MNVNTLTGMNAYGFVNKLTSSESSGTSGATGSSGGGFGDLVAQGIGSAVDTLKSSEKVTLDSIAGKASLADVVTAVNSADVALKSVISIRDKVINAYQDILKMPI